MDSKHDEKVLIGILVKLSMCWRGRDDHIVALACFLGQTVFKRPFCFWLFSINLTFDALFLVVFLVSR
jgi:hypothetical protein